MKLRPLPPDAPICTSGKVPHRTEADARHALGAARASRADRSGQRRRPGDTESAVYLCKGCGWWHLAAARGRQSRGSIGARIDTNQQRGARRR